MSNIQILNPDSLGKPLGQYSNVTRRQGVGVSVHPPARSASTRTARRRPNFEAQLRPGVRQTRRGARSQGASFANIVEFTTYLVHSQDIAKFMPTAPRVPAPVRRRAPYPPTRSSSSTGWCRGGVCDSSQL